MQARRNSQHPSIKAKIALKLASFLGAIGQFLPIRVGYWLSDRLGHLIYALTPSYRRNVRANLAHVMNLADTDPEVRRLAKRVFTYSARNFYDLMRVARLSADDLRSAVIGSAESWARLDRVRAAGKGGIVVSAHYGAFDYTGHAILTNGYSIIPLTTRTVPEPVYQVVTHLRKSHGLVVAEANASGVRRVLAAIRRGEFAGLLADRDFFNNGIPVKFFGVETTLPSGPARIARDTGAPIILVFNKRVSSGYIFTVEEPFTVERTDDAERDICRATERIVAYFEEHIRENPEQWVMFQRVWPELETASAPALPRPSLTPLVLDTDGVQPGPSVSGVMAAPVDGDSLPASKVES